MDKTYSSDIEGPTKEQELEMAFLDIEVTAEQARDSLGRGFGEAISRIATINRMLSVALDLALDLYDEDIG